MLRVAALWFAFAVPAAADPVASVQVLWQGGDMKVETYGGSTPDSTFAIASVGKTLTSVVILSLVEEGALQLDAPIAPLLPEDVTDGLGGLDGITLRHLLTMESGLPDYYDYTFLTDALDDPESVATPQDAVSYAYDLPAQFEPGTRFDYSNTNYVLLGLIAERITGQSYARLIQSRVLDPAGMADSFVFGSMPLPDSFVTGHERRVHVRDYYNGTGFGDGGVISTGPDLVRFYNALFFDRILISDTSLREMMRDPRGDQYGMGLVVGGDTIGHSGADLGFSAEVMANLKTGDIAVILIAKDSADTDWVYDQVGD